MATSPNETVSEAIDRKAMMNFLPQAYVAQQVPTLVDGDLGVE
jgi:hypothetical protein